MPDCLADGHSVDTAERAPHVRYWPVADIASCAAHVRFRGGSGHVFLRMPSSKSEALTRELKEATPQLTTSAAVAACVAAETPVPAVV